MMIKSGTLAIIPHIESIVSLGDFWMFNMILAMLWSTAILLSFTGWGIAVNGIVLPKKEVNSSLQAVWGLSLTIAIGGVANLLGLISKEFICIYTTLGIIILLIYYYKNAAFYQLSKNNYNKYFIIVFTILLLFCIQRYIESLWTANFNMHDDFQAYLIFPKKMIEMGSFGSDPFNERRIVTSFGGSSFLQAMIISILPIESITVMDRGIGYILLIWLVAEFIIKQKLSLMIVFIVGAILLTTRYPFVNITFIIIPIALFISLVMTLDWLEENGSNHVVCAIIIALVSSALCSLKTNLIPTCIIFLFLSYIFLVIKHHQRLTECLLTGLFILLFLAPWMISMKINCGTYLFPVLGKGYHGFRYGIYEPNSLRFSIVISLLEVFTSIIFIGLVVLSIIYIKYRKNHSERDPIISLVIGSICGIVIIAISGGDYALSRYCFPFIFSSVLILSILSFKNLQSLKNDLIIYGKITPYLFIVIITYGLLIGQNFDDYRKYCKMNFVNFIESMGNISIVKANNIDVNQYRNMQERIPKGEILLVRLSYPFFLNYTRNIIWTMDYPGGASLPPGIPIFQGEEHLIQYLKSVGIRFIAYSYKDECNFSTKTPEYYRRVGPQIHPYIRSEAKSTFEFQKTMMVLSNKYKIIYDDGNMFLMDIDNKT